MTDREKLIDIINTACEGYAENLMQPYGAEVLADYLIANGARISPWISVKDRLPEQDVYVLCYYTDSGKYQYQTVGRLWSVNGKWDLDIDREYDIEDEKVVTHWMTLPEPPKEAENADG